MGAAARINGREHVGREIHIGLHCCFFYCILLQSSNTHYLLIRLLFQNHHTLHKGSRGHRELDSSKKQRQRPRSSTRDTDQKLPHLPMPQNEAHELPLPRTTHPTTSQTTKWERGNHQHASSSNQTILRHPIQRQKP